jgi:lipopolysaccharide transport system permease protein
MSSAVEAPLEERLPVSRESAMPAVEPADDLPVTVIERRSSWQIVDLRELWRYHELLYFLVWRDVKVRYKQTALGAAWAVLQPLATVVVFSLFLGKMSGLAREIPNYPLFVLAGILPWTFFANSLSSAAVSVIGNQNLVSKVYFPRLLIPLGVVGAGALDFLIGFAMLLLALLWYIPFGNQPPPGWGLFLAPLVFLMLLVATFGVGALLAALTVAYRDFRYVVAFSIQIWMFATPSIYVTESKVGPLSSWLLPLNPAYGLIQNFRATLMDGRINWYSLAVSSVVSVLLMVVGCLYYRRVERTFADII